MSSTLGSRDDDVERGLVVRIKDGSDSEEELPAYNECAGVVENESNMVVNIRVIDRDPIVLQVADIDSVNQIKERIRRHSFVPNTQLELRLTLTSTILNDSSSLAQLCISNGAVLDLCIVDAEGVVMAPDENGKAEPLKSLSGRKQGSFNNGSIKDDDEEESSPPEYSIIDIFRGTRDRLDGRTELTGRQKLYHYLIFSLMLVLSVAAFVAIPISLITVGVLSLHRCPAQPSLPVWMIVFGVMYLLGYLLERFGDRTKKSIEKQLRKLPEYEVMPPSAIKREVGIRFHKKYKCIDQMDRLLQTFLLIWFVIGSVWVFGCDGCVDDFDVDTNTGCDVHAFKFSYILLILVFAAIALPLILILTYLCVSISINRRET